MTLSTQRRLPLEISARCPLVTVDFVRNLRGCDAESVFDAVGDATHPKFLRWVFNVAVNPQGDIRELRFWRDEVAGEKVMRNPEAVITAILGARKSFPRGEIEVAWTINATTLMRLVRTGELIEVNRHLTRASLAQFLQKRLQ